MGETVTLLISIAALCYVCFLLGGLVALNRVLNDKIIIDKCNRIIYLGKKISKYLD